jgi:SOS-response transcriptional repressor LexA
MLDENCGKVFEFIRNYLAARHMAPSMKEIAAGCAISETTARKYFQMLEASGYLTRDKGRVRAIRILKVG